MCAFELVISRYGDVDTEDGSFATCGTDEIIRLDEAMAHFFDVGSDDLELHYADLILKKSKQLDQHIELIAKQAGQIKMLRDALELVRPEVYYNQDGVEVWAGGHMTIGTDDDADNETMQKIHEALSATEQE